MANAAQHKIDSYLEKLRQGLCGMSDVNAHEIVEELRSHILDKASAGGDLTEPAVDMALAALGTPEILAKEYLTDELLARTASTRSPVRIIDGLFRWASLSVAGLFALLASLAGYSFGFLCLLCALLKAVHPRTAGVWSLLDASGDTTISVRLGFGPAPQNGHDLLGLWIVPFGLAAGFTCLLLTTSFARWCIRQFRQTQAFPRSS
jgi:uncharacterized membrane protein